MRVTFAKAPNGEVRPRVLDTQGLRRTIARSLSAQTGFPPHAFRFPKQVSSKGFLFGEVAVRADAIKPFWRGHAQEIRRLLSKFLCEDHPALEALNELSSRVSGLRILRSCLDDIEREHHLVVRKAFVALPSTVHVRYYYKVRMRADLITSSVVELKPMPLRL